MFTSVLSLFIVKEYPLFDCWLKLMRFVSPFVCRERTVQLLSRHWIIKDPDGKVIAEVAKGAKGVVGCTPILKPKTCFQYYSGTDLRKAGGTMEGSFGMAVLSTQGVPESYFDAEIGQFKFARPEGEKYREGK